MRKRLIGAIDVGTTSVRFTVFKPDWKQVASHQEKYPQMYPGPGMHTQDPNSYISTVLSCISTAMSESGLSKSAIAGVGITNQRETIVAWDRKTKEPLAEAIVWDDVRTAKDCDALAKHLGGVDAIRAQTGLPINPYFSGTKIAWLVNNRPAVRSAVERGDCCFSTVESWVISKLTDVKAPVTDVTNACRTLLLGLDGKWDDGLCRLFGVGQGGMPEVRSCSEVYGHFTDGPLAGLPLCGAIGDQQAALLGHGCTGIGDLKNTYGTGSFLLMNTGDRPVPSSSGLLTTISGQFAPGGDIRYALEGAVEAAGSCVEWAIKQVGLAKDLEEFGELVRGTTDNGGVYFVPALGGLFTPYWRNDARGLFIGLTRHTTRGHMLRAILEGISFRTAEAVHAMEKDLKIEVKEMSADGGMIENKQFMQLQSDILRKKVVISDCKEMTSIGAAQAALIGSGEVSRLEEIDFASVRNTRESFTPNLNRFQCDALWSQWRKAVSRSFDWETKEGGS